MKTHKTDTNTLIATRAQQAGLELNLQRLLFTAWLCCIITAGISSGQAATATKAATGTELTGATAGVWSGGSGANGAPTSADVAVWDSSSLGAGLTLASSASWGSINVSGSSSASIDITGAGTLSIGAGGITIAATAKDMSIANATTLSSDQTWEIGSGRTLTTSGATGTSSRTLTKAGLGTLVKTAADSYGAVTINAGTLKGRAGSAASTVTINTGATWDLGGVQRECNILQGAGGMVVNNGANVLLLVGNSGGSGSYPGTIANGTHTLGFRKRGTGTTTLTGVNTFTGNITVDTGTGPLVIGGAGQLGSGSYAGTITFTGTGTLQYESSASQTLSGVISGGGALVKNGSGTLTLTVASTYSGTTTISGGKLVGRVGGSANNSAVTVNNTAGCVLGVSVIDNTKQWSCSSLTFGGANAALEVDFGSTTPSASLAPLKVNGDVIFTGTPTVNIIGTAIPATSATYPLVTWTGAANSANAPTTVILPSPLNGSLSLSGDGKTLNLNIVAGATQPLTWTAGTATWDTSTANWTNALGAATAYTDTSDNVVFSDVPNGSGPFAVTLNSGLFPVSVLVSNETKAYTISGLGGIAGSASLVKDGAGALTISVANTYSGGTSVSNGTLTISGSGTLGGSSGALTVAGGSVNLGGTSQSAGTVTLSGGTIQNGNLTGTAYALQSGTVSAALGGGATLTKTTTGTVILSGPSSYTGGTALNSGILRLNAAENVGVSGPLGASGSISLGGGTLQYTSVNNFDYSSRFSAPAAMNIDLNGQVVTFATTISSSGSLTLSDSAGGGILSLTGANGYTGGTVINSGTVRGKPGSQSGAVTMNGGTIDLNGGGVIIGALNGAASAQVINNGSSAAGFSICLGYSGTTANFQGVIRDGTSTTSLTTRHTSGVFTLSGANTYSGNTTVSSGGILKLAHSQAIQNSTILNPEGIVFDSSVASHAFVFGDFGASSANLALQDNAGTPNPVTLFVGNNNGSHTYSGAMSGDGSLVKIGTGRLILSGANNYTGPTVVSNGTLFVYGAIAGAATVKTNATLGGYGNIGGPVTIETGGTIAAGAFGVSKLTTGALTLNAGATNVWEIASATGTAGTDWDLLDAGANNVDVQSSAANPVTLKLISVGLSNFNKDTAYSWPVIAGTALNFAANKFAIDDTGFTSDLAGGYFYVDSGSIKLGFTNNHSPTAGTVSYSFAKGVPFKPFDIPIAQFLASNTADADGDARGLVALVSTNAAVSTNVSPGNITISSDNGIEESIAYVIRDIRNYRAGDSVRYATNYIHIVRTNSVGSVSISNSGGTNMTLSFYAIPGLDYVVQRSPDMSGWTDIVTNTAAANGLVEYAETPPYSPAYYRMRQE